MTDDILVDASVTVYIASEVLTKGVLFLRKFKAEFVLTNLKILAVRLS